MDLLLYATSQDFIDKDDYVNIKVISKTYRNELERKIINNMVKRRIIKKKINKTFIYKKRDSVYKENLSFFMFHIKEIKIL